MVIFKKQLKEWLETKGAFPKPKVSVHFGRWRNMPFLPVWRTGYIINIGKRSQTYIPKDSIMIQNGTKECEYGGKVHTIKCYETCYHKLPVKRYQRVWRSDIRRKLRKYHLSWIPPQIELPLFLYFRIFNCPLMWKTKFDDYCFEFPPQFTIVFFGLSLTLVWHAPTSYMDDMDYYEEILYYLYDKENNKIKNDIY